MSDSTFPVWYLIIYHFLEYFGNLWDFFGTDRGTLQDEKTDASKSWQVFFPKKFQIIIGPLLLSSSLSVSLSLSLSFSTSLLLFLIGFSTLCLLLIKALKIAQKQYGEGYHNQYQYHHHHHYNHHHYNYWLVLPTFCLFPKALDVAQTQYGEGSKELIPIYQCLTRAESSHGDSSSHERATKHLLKAHDICISR